jgi:cytidylate kinase
MSVITISRGSSTKGQQIAVKVAEKLGYTCVAREVLLEASEQFNIPEARLVRAIHDSPSVFERWTHGKERYIAYIRAALLGYLRRDNVIYHGLAGHFFVKDVPHVLKVRVIADLAQRVQIVMERDNVPRSQAEATLERDDDERRRWSRALYGIDTADPLLYDLVLHVGRLSVDEAVDVICHTVELPSFRSTPEAQQAMEDLALAALVQAALVKLSPVMRVTASRGKVRIAASMPSIEVQATVRQIEQAALAIPGVTAVEVKPELVTMAD